MKRSEGGEEAIREGRDGFKAPGGPVRGHLLKKVLTPRLSGLRLGGALLLTCLLGLILRFETQPFSHQLLVEIALHCVQDRTTDGHRNHYGYAPHHLL